MSTQQVEVVKIDSIIPHPNADRLEIAQVKGWQVVTQKGTFQAGTLGVYFPIDSILPEELEANSALIKKSESGSDCALSEGRKSLHRAQDAEMH